MRYQPQAELDSAKFALTTEATTKQEETLKTLLDTQHKLQQHQVQGRVFDISSLTTPTIFCLGNIFGFCARRRRLLAHSEQPGQKPSKPLPLPSSKQRASRCDVAAPCAQLVTLVSQGDLLVTRTECHYYYYYEY